VLPLSVFLLCEVSWCTSLIERRFSHRRHEAERREQEAKGLLERQKITDEAAAERARKELLELQVCTALCDLLLDM